MHKNLYSLILIVLINLLAIQSFGQEVGNLIFTANKDGTVNLDGEELGEFTKNQVQKFPLTPGDHFLQVKTIDGQVKDTIFSIEANKQLIIKLNFTKKSYSSNKNKVLIADLGFDIPGSSAVGIWQNNNPGLDYPNHPTFYYAFEEGDEIILNFEMTNRKGTNQIAVYSYPEFQLKYSNNEFQELKDVRVRVEKRGIYIFVLATNHLFSRSAQLRIERKPGSVSTVDFITSVRQEVKYTPVTIVEKQKNYINSGTNATFLEGKSRVIIPVNLPPNTVQWYYKIAASRDEAEINSTAEKMNLVSELSSLIDQTGTLSFGVELLSRPPASNHCDIYLLDYQNQRLFTNKQTYSYGLEGTRENINSGNVQITCCNNGQFYLGLKNPDSMYGIHTVIEVVAITAEEVLIMEAEAGS
ncbi:hypothetical protein [Nafulsella turpanensis]|uniref:hypothetical protein n=1 Tax=Nafulsella turpanensis TaxID=1265690 RepID=UPI0003489908|nr:hypothetical protein [Nafulsella turpanensis]